MNDIGPGDLVECVDASVGPFGESCPLVVGAIYTVAAVSIAPAGWSDAGDVGLILHEVKPGKSGLGYEYEAFSADRFRPIRRPSEKFMQLLTEPVDLEGVLA